jgi:hypothetical protein
MKNTFAGIAEGLTDQIVIENILAGYFNPDIDINWLQPLRDATDANRSSNFGGWSQVFEYCRSTAFKEAFQFNEYIIIQIDTDISEEQHYNVPHRDENGEFTPEQLIDKVIDKFKGLMSEDFYSQYKDKIIFAIAVHSMECWLLPLYYTDNKKTKIKSCLLTLNQALQKIEGFTIDANKKKPEYYRNISHQYCKGKTLMKLYKENPSFKLFIEEIQKRNIVIQEDDF